MTDGLAGVVLAAGAGLRLRPLTLLRPKPLCPIGGVPLVDLALARVQAVVDDVAVNVHHGRAAMESHLTGRARLSIEEGGALGTAGALGLLRGWLDGRAAVVVNADAWCPAGLEPLLEGWDGERIRLLLVGDGVLTPVSLVAGALMPWTTLAGLEAVPSGLYERCWAPAAIAGRLEVVRHDGPFVDCGTPAQYLAANLVASEGASVVGAGARIRGALDRCVVWSEGVVWPHESLTCAIRMTEVATVLIR